MANKKQIAAITVVFSEQDGIVHARSPQLPSLHVCGKTRAAVFADTPGLIRQLYKLKHGWDVDVEPAATTDFKQAKAPVKGQGKGVANFLAVPKDERQPA